MVVSADSDTTDNSYVEIDFGEDGEETMVKEYSSLKSALDDAKSYLKLLDEKDVDSLRQSLKSKGFKSIY